MALLDPHGDPFLLQVMLEAAHNDKEVEEALVNGWSAALDNTSVHAECRRLIDGWAHARAENLVRPDQVIAILNQVIRRHLMSVPISALLFGDPAAADGEAVIALRRDLILPAQLRRFQVESSMES
ncbi:hypothetical protein [Streptomyces sp. NPDC006307]|uniref:hypothetical protein n=1 Tax=Streptomyces sp. NPDC006307 TaxID=3156748 RepID=UPI0033A8F550